DHLTLLFQLFHSYKKVNPVKDSFDQFYHWGEMLLRDFDEIDKYLIDANDLFKNLKNQKDLEDHFNYLTQEQIAVIRQFWASFEGKKSRHQEGFLQVWDILSKVYSSFKEDLLNQHIGYDGMIFRTVAEKAATTLLVDQERKIVFAGFNALSKAEEIIISSILENTDADIFWDLDTYYFNNSDQEAGYFFRRYSKHNVFGKTFPKAVS